MISRKKSVPRPKQCVAIDLTPEVNFLPPTHKYLDKFKRKNLLNPVLKI